ncbi:MAG: hypothetical protein K2W82_05265 [Candidatus Obscuribacterales bacterium]|nr:hypothetical protein [Candidatus Obscuribacterales bacterium]
MRLLGRKTVMLLIAYSFVSFNFSAQALRLPADAENTESDSGKKSLQIKPDILNIRSEYSDAISQKINNLVENHFFNGQVATKIWPEIYRRYKERISQAKDYIELGEAINAALAELHTSHTQFITINDELFYFLDSLFSTYETDQTKKAAPMDFTGLGVAGAGYKSKTVRYILDGSPAAIAGFQRGDSIETVAEQAYLGQSSFIGTAGKTLNVRVQRGPQTLTLKLQPLKADLYSKYAEAITNSIKIYPSCFGNIGYIHLWSGGEKAHEALEEALEGQLHNTAGLILDLRDGYGANSLSDLDYFFRPPQAYPVFKTVDQKGVSDNSYHVYTKPLVVLANSGSRSGKELLAYSLKKSKRGTLVGEKTAGYVVAGRFFKLDDKCALYLAIKDGTIDGKRLEGVGVKPDIEIKQSDKGDHQFEIARQILLRKIAVKKNASKRQNFKNP